MASAWGQAFGSAWGDAWGSLGAAVESGPPPIAYWDVLAMQPQKKKRKSRQQELETWLLLLG